MKLFPIGSHHSIMRHFIAIIIFLWCAIPSFAQAGSRPEWKDVVGTWTGYYLQNDQKRTITLVFSITQGSATINLPDDLVTAAACKVTTCEAGDFHIVTSGPGKSFTFVARPEGDTMRGKYKVGGSCGPGERMEFQVERRKATL
jgi:hypothetical protein